MKKTITLFLTLFLLSPQIWAATYYVDAVNGNDSNPGTSEQPWKTIERAYDANTSNPNVEPGDTVYLRSGNYEDFTEYGDIHSDWIYYEAETGEIPIFTYLGLGSTGGQYVKKLSFKGITITYSGITNAVLIRECNDVILDKLTIQGNTSTYDSRGIYLWYGQNVIIQNCTIESIGDVNAFNNGIFSRFSHDITVNNCTISHCDYGIRAWGRRWEITNNVLRNLYSDGILAEGVCDTNITGNLIYDIDIREGSLAHTDGFQIYYTGTGNAQDPNSADHVYIENIKFANNIIHTIERQGIFINPGDYEGSPPCANNITIENNLVYNTDTGDSGAYTFTSYNNSNQIFRNNVITGSAHWRSGSNVNIVSGNLLMLGVFWIANGVGDPCYMGHNIVWDWWDVNEGATDIETRWDWGDSTKSLWKGLFADYDNGDFRLANGSQAIDVIPLDEAPVTDLEGNSRIDIQGVGNDGTDYADAGCYEYYEKCKKYLIVRKKQ